MNIPNTAKQICESLNGADVRQAIGSDETNTMIEIVEDAQKFELFDVGPLFKMFRYLIDTPMFSYPNARPQDAMQIKPPYPRCLFSFTLPQTGMLAPNGYVSAPRRAVLALTNSPQENADTAIKPDFSVNFVHFTLSGKKWMLSPLIFCVKPTPEMSTEKSVTEQRLKAFEKWEKSAPRQDAERFLRFERASVLGDITAVSYAIQLLNAKGITTEQIQVGGRPKHKQRAAVAGYSYHVLVVDPKHHRATGDSSNGGGDSHDKKRLHMCRGHIKRYTAERPLFGHYVGLVWCPPHVRGDDSLGVVEKDYAVKA